MFSFRSKSEAKPPAPKRGGGDGRPLKRVKQLYQVAAVLLCSFALPNEKAPTRVGALILLTSRSPFHKNNVGGTQKVPGKIITQLENIRSLLAGV